MTSDLNELARRAVACKNWKWMPGMACVWDRPGGAGGQQVLPTWARVVDLPMGPLPLTYCLVDPNSVYRGGLPDLTDPATLGCLLALVREAWGNHRLHTRWDARTDTWVLLSRFTDHGDGDTEAEALVAALDAAP